MLLKGFGRQTRTDQVLQKGPEAGYQLLACSCEQQATRRKFARSSPVFAEVGYPESWAEQDLEAEDQQEAFSVST